MMLNLLTFFLSNAGAPFFSFPRYVGLNSFHGMNTKDSSACAASSDTLKSYSYEIVACSRPFSGFFGSSSSFKMKV